MPPTLVAPIVWRKPRPTNRTRRASDLTPEEQANAKAALHVLRTRLGGTKQLAEVLAIKPATLAAMLSKPGKPTAGLALRAARLTGVPLEDVLAGEWPKEGACPHCGRADQSAER
jgi:hypothetical protein